MGISRSRWTEWKWIWFTDPPGVMEIQKVSTLALDDASTRKSCSSGRVNA